MRAPTGVWLLIGLAAVAAILPFQSGRSGDPTEQGANNSASDPTIDKLELANVEFQAHKDLYNQAVEGLKTVPTRIAPLFAFGAALIGFLATSVVKEFGPELVGRPDLAPYLQWGIVAVIVFTTISLSISGMVLAQVAAVVYLPPRQKLKQFLQGNGEVGLYVEEGARVVSEIIAEADYDPKSAVVMYQAEIMSRQARALLEALGRARSWIGCSVVCLIIAFTITITGFSYCITKLGLTVTTSAKGSPSTTSASNPPINNAIPPGSIPGSSKTSKGPIQNKNSKSP